MAADRLAGTVGAIALLVTGAARADVTISKQPTQNMNCQAGVCSPTASKAVLNVGDLANMLAGGDVKIASGSLAQDIDVDAALNWTSTSRLTLDAYHSIAFNKPVVVAGFGALTITTSDGGSGGDFRFLGKGHVEFGSTDDSLIINQRPYVLTSSIRELRRLVRHNQNGSFALSKHITSRKVYTDSPIGILGGILEGLGNTISGLTIESSRDRESVAFIGQLFPGAGSLTGIVRDIGLKDVEITGSGAECIGALLGFNASGTIANSYATGSVTATSSMSIAGGLLCDNNFGSVRGSSSEVTVVGADNTPVGGLVGLNEEACSGTCFGLIDQSFSQGSVSGGAGGMLGGLIGRNLGGRVTNSYATGSVTGGSGAFIGGLVGSNENNDAATADPVIMNAYSVGLVSGGPSATVGGLVGQDIAAPGISDAYWDMDTSGISDPAQGAGNVQNDPGITGLTTQEFTSGLPAGFSPSIWKEKPTVNSGYPYLIDNPPPKKQDAPARP